jgi:outer membrane protein assembly factor BamB
LRKQLLSLCITVLAVTGCRRASHEVGPMIELPAGAFTSEWRAEPPLRSSDNVKSIHLVDDSLYVYTRENSVVSVSLVSGKLNWSAQVADPADILRPPLAVNDKLVFPTASTMQIFSKHGQKIRTMDIGHNMRSGASVSGEFVYVGLDYSLGGRIAKIDTTREYSPTRWELMTSAGVSAAPVYFNAAVFAAGEDGSVYAVNEDRQPIWSLPNFVFRTDGRILADLRVDDYGVYVASTDSKLYCLDRVNGKIRWQYFAGTPLLDAPLVTNDSVYQYVPNAGLTAIDKSTGEFIRKARWVAPDARQFLAADEKYVYVSLKDHRIAALDKATGEIKFTSERTDLTIFAANTKTGVIYAATTDGLVLAVKPVTKAGTVGEMVRGELELEVVAINR